MTIARSGPPFDNCAFRICDLRGQCIAEGACHHAASRVTELELALAELLPLVPVPAAHYGEPGTSRRRRAIYTRFLIRRVKKLLNHA